MIKDLFQLEVDTTADPVRSLGVVRLCDVSEVCVCGNDARWPAYEIVLCEDAVC